MNFLHQILARFVCYNIKINLSLMINLFIRMLMDGASLVWTGLVSVGGDTSSSPR